MTMVLSEDHIALLCTLIRVSVVMGVWQGGGEGDSMSSRLINEVVK